MAGMKHDDGKPRLDLIPPSTVFALGEVLKVGAAKYGDNNWREGIAWGRVFAAMMRHMWAWWGGERNDPEDGLPHLHHALACLAFLIEYEAAQKYHRLDDRAQAD